MNERKLTRGLDDIAPNNSDKAFRANNQEQRKKLEPVVKGPVVRQKVSAFSKFKGSFLGDAVDNFWEYVLYDVLGPAFRDTMSDMGFGIITMLFGGGRGYNSKHYDPRVMRDRGRSYISYNDVAPRERRDPDRGERTRHDFSNFIYNSRGEAEEVLSHLVDLTIEYGEATVAAFYELSNVESEHTDLRYGWTNLRDAYTERTRGGYIIKFPQVRPL